MKHSYFAILITSLMIAPGLIAHAETPRIDLSTDTNAAIRAEFADDLPKTYNQAITELRGGTTPTATQGQPRMDSATPFSFTDATPEYVRVVHTGNAKLFGFLPVPVSVEIAAYPDGSVRVALPWYRFLLTHDDIPTIENNLEAKIQTTTTLPSPSGTISVEAQQAVLGLFSAELGNYFK